MILPTLSAPLLPIKLLDRVDDNLRRVIGRAFENWDGDCDKAEMLSADRDAEWNTVSLVSFWDAKRSNGMGHDAHLAGHGTMEKQEKRKYRGPPRRVLGWRAGAPHQRREGEIVFRQIFRLQLQIPSRYCRTGVMWNL